MNLDYCLLIVYKVKKSDNQLIKIFFDKWFDLNELLFKIPN